MTHNAFGIHLSNQQPLSCKNERDDGRMSEMRCWLYMSKKSLKPHICLETNHFYHKAKISLLQVIFHIEFLPAFSSKKSWPIWQDSWTSWDECHIYLHIASSKVTYLIQLMLYTHMSQIQKWNINIFNILRLTLA